ncbi:MAG: sulfotransferase [Gemmatimonadota bacterium]
MSATRARTLASDLSRYLASRRIRDGEFIVPQSSNRFVGGITGRTGTSWLMRLLGAVLDRRFAMIGEHGTFVLSQFRHAGYEYYQSPRGDRSRERYLRYFHDFVTGPGFDRHEVYALGLRGLSGIVPRRAVRLAFGALRGDLASAASLPECNHAFGRFYSRVLNFHALQTVGTLDWISKEPPYGRHLNDLHALVPDCRVVVLCRDGRDTALSMYRRGWHPDLSQCIDRWRLFTEQTLASLEAVPAENWLLVRYEDLVHDPASCVGRILDFFAIERPGNLLARLSAEGFGEAPRAQNFGRWREAFSATELEYFQRTCRDAMTHLGYDTAT